MYLENVCNCCLYILTSQKIYVSCNNSDVFTPFCLIISRIIRLTEKVHWSSNLSHCSVNSYSKSYVYANKYLESWKLHEGCTFQHVGLCVKCMAYDVFFFLI